MLATVHTTSSSEYVWVRKDNPELYMGQTLYLSPKDSINNYTQVIPVEDVEEVI